MDFAASIKRNLATRAYADFSGRASRSEYWWFYLFTMLATAAAGALGSSICNFVSIALFLPSVALFVRRLHDVGRRGWWFLVAFTIVGIFLLLYFLVRRSDAGPNRFGEGPAQA